MKIEFQEAIIKLITEHYPKALTGGVEQSTEAGAELAMALGGIVAFAFRLNGEVAGRTVLTTIIKTIVDNAAAIDEKSADMIREQIPKLYLN